MIHIAIHWCNSDSCQSPAPARIRETSWLLSLKNLFVAHSNLLKTIENSDWTIFVGQSFLKAATEVYQAEHASTNLFYPLKYSTLPDDKT